MSYYTGFTTRCKKCNTDIRSKYIGKNFKGISSIILFCKCTPLKFICPMCDGKVGKRKGTGPTGNKDIFILADECYSCGSLVPVQDISLKEWQWVDRWNKRSYESYLKTLIKKE